MIEVKKLTKIYGKVEALKGISFTVKPGEIYGLLGPNGAGKSTTINIISGLVVPSGGSASIGAFDISSQPTDAKKILGVVPQQSIVIEELSALQNCLFFGSLYGVPRGELKERALELLKWVELSDRLKEPVSQFSGGMMRRLTLVLGLLHRPEALILDEPTVGLDPQTRLQILEHVENIAKQGTAVLFSTHYLDEAERLCHRVGIIDEGTIIKEGTLVQLRAEVEDVQLIHLRGLFEPGTADSLMASLSGEILQQNPGEIVISIPAAASNVTTLLEKASALDNVKEVSVRPPSLESLFIHLTGKEIRD
jgi:ABC-2 type transport system ATP-binding protein